MLKEGVRAPPTVKDSPFLSPLERFGQDHWLL